MKHQADAVAITNLNFAYRRKSPTLRDLHLHVPQGAIFAFVGENGAGKSTTLKHIVGLLPDPGQRVRLFGQPLRKHRRDIMARVGALIEAPSCHYHLSGYDNLLIHCRYRNLPPQRIEAVAAEVALTPNLHKKCKAYSTGMKQRLGLAIALLSDPELLLLDEPSNGLDPTGRIALRKLLLELNQRGKTILVSSHLLAEIELIATHVGIIKDGTLLYQGSMDQLRRLRQKHTLLWIETSEAERAETILSTAYAVARSHTHPDRCRVEIGHREDIPRIVALLHSAGIRIYALEREKKGLEQLFIDSIAV